MRASLLQFARFSAVGMTAFGIDYTIMIVMTSVIGVEYMISTTVGFLVSVIFSYFMTTRFVFTHRSDISRKREFSTFVILSAIGLMLNDSLMFFGTSLIDIDYRITKLVVAAIVSFYNFFSRKLFLERNGHGASTDNEVL